MPTMICKMKTFIWSCILLSIGAIVALFLQDLRFFVYDNSFNLFDLLYFVLTIAIAIFVTSRLDESLQRRRSQKDIIIRKIEEVDTAIKDLYNLFSYDSASSQYVANNTSILSDIKNISLWAKRYERSISEYYSAIENDVKYSRINTRKLVSACTKLYRNSNSDEISCSNNKWFYSEGRYTLIQTEIEKLRNICYQNVILLNNAV